MIRSHFGLELNPFDDPTPTLLAHQKTIFETIKVHAQQGGLCVIVEEPGTGKTVIKHAIIQHDPKRMITPAIARTLHTYSNTLHILAEAFGIEVSGRDTRREKLLIEASWNLNHEGKIQYCFGRFQPFSDRSLFWKCLAETTQSCTCRGVVYPTHSVTQLQQCPHDECSDATHPAHVCVMASPSLHRATSWAAKQQFVEDRGVTPIGR